MATAIIVILLILICVFSVRSYMKKLSHGCCGVGGDDEKAPETKADLSKYKYKYTVKIGGMSCKNCASKIENALNRKDGLYAKADFKKGTTEIYSNDSVTEFSIRL